MQFLHILYSCYFTMSYKLVRLILLDVLCGVFYFWHKMSVSNPEIGTLRSKKLLIRSHDP